MEDAHFLAATNQDMVTTRRAQRSTAPATV